MKRNPFILGMYFILNLFFSNSNLSAKQWNLHVCKKLFRRVSSFISDQLSQWDFTGSRAWIQLETCLPRLAFSWTVFVSSLWRDGCLGIKGAQTLGLSQWSKLTREESYSCRQVWTQRIKMREIVHLQAGQCGNQIGAKVSLFAVMCCVYFLLSIR